MSEASAEEVEEQVEQDEPAETSEDEGEELPDIEADERAEIDLGDLADQVEADAGQASSDDQAEAGDDSDVETSDDQATDQPESSAKQATWGDQYVDILALLLAAVAEDNGGDVDNQELIDLATSEPINLAENFDRMLEQRGKGTELPPEKAVLFGSGALVAVVLLKETDIVDQAAEKIMEEIDL